MRGKTLGIVGLGKIGAAVARRARAFEMECIGFDPIVSAADARAMGVEPVTFDEVFPRAEVLTLHAPMLPATKGMVGAAQIARMPRGAVLVNAARGGLVDEVALVEALRTGALAGAALDVYADEPPKGSPLLSLPNVVLTPHIGAATVEAQEAVGEEIVRLLCAPGAVSRTRGRAFSRLVRLERTAAEVAPEGVAVAAARITMHAPPLHPDERPRTSDYGPLRFQEFSWGRACARRALTKLGGPATLPSARPRTVLPDGRTGSRAAFPIPAERRARSRLWTMPSRASGST